MTKEVKVLMGTTTNNTLVFADIRVGECGEPRDYFSVSFDEVEPVVATDKYLRSRVGDMIECGDDDYILSLLKEYDCKYSHLPATLFRNLMSNYGIEGILDISLYPETFSIKGVSDEICFESGSCGQHDTRDILVPIDKDFSDWLHKKWDRWHLKPLNEVQKLSFNEVIDNYRDKIEELGGEEAIITEWLQKLVDNGDL